MKCRIYIAAHKQFEQIDLPDYVPIQVGAALSDRDLGFIRDDTGDHISEKNPFYSELTAFYWVWKNDRDSDILGLVHYRRYFLDEKKGFLSSEQTKRMLEDADLLLPERIELDEETVEKQYSELHHIEDLYAVKKAMETLCPEYLPAFLEVLQGNYTYCCNMLIAKAELVKAYAAWLFPLLFETEKHLDISGYDVYNRRCYGLLAERLLTVWVVAKKLRVKELPIGCTEEKTETREYRLRCEELIRKGDYEGAYSVVSEAAALRSDCFLPNSDVYHKLGGYLTLLSVWKGESGTEKESRVWELRDPDRLLSVFLEIERRIDPDQRREKAEGRNPKQGEVGVAQFLEEYGIRPLTIVVMLQVRNSDVTTRMQCFAKIAESYAAIGMVQEAGQYATLAMRYAGQ